MIATDCIHDEILKPAGDGTGDDIGTCQKCGQEKRYPGDRRSKPIILKEGVAPEPIDDPRSLPVERKREIAREAKEHGVKPVAEKYGYDWRVVRAWVGVYCRERLGGRPRSVVEIKATIEAMQLVKNMLKPTDDVIRASLDGSIKSLQWVLGNTHQEVHQHGYEARDPSATAG